jgi:hypothetical protein
MYIYLSYMWDFIVIKELSELSENKSKVIIEYKYVTSFKNVDLPNNITHLDLYKLKNTYIKNFLFPPNLIFLKFNLEFNINLDNMLNHLTQLSRLIFNRIYNQPIDIAILPLSIVYLNFGDNYNHSVNNLPHDLQYLIFGISFNNFVDNLPYNLKYLEFCGYFNKPLENLPNSLLYLKLLTINECFGEFIEERLVSINFLPSSLKCLELYADCDYQMDNLPSSIEYIKCRRSYCREKKMSENFENYCKDNVNKIHYI